MKYRLIILTMFAVLLLGSIVLSQPPKITMEMVNRQLPLEGAPKAITGPYTTTYEAAFDSPRHILYRPTDLAAFPGKDTLPVVVWGNGGCAIESRQYEGYLRTIASHGFLVITTVSVKGDEEGRRQNVNDLLSAISWAEAENARSGSLLKGKIDTGHVFVMGQSCGGFLSVAAGADPRVDSIGVFNSGVAAPNPEAKLTKL